MVDLHETNNPERRPQIDTVGWLFLTFAVAITAAAAIVAYEANDTTVANAPVSHVVAR
jgi:quinol-cytochrome oxidoreductase complex cytochrome b subunit